jgi:fumarylacetoacetate (FAA) hydrolase
VRDFYAFERHVKASRLQRGVEIAPEWYQLPVFYFSNPAAIIGPEEEVRFPPESVARDYELEAAAVIGASGRIAGFTIMNDWSARDLSARR